MGDVEWRCSWPSTKNHQDAYFVMGSDAFERVTVRKTVHWTIGPDVLNRTRFPHTHTHRVKQEALMLRGTSWILGPEQFWAASRCSHNCIPIQTPSKNYGEGSCWSCFSGSIPASKCTQSSVDYAIHKSLTTKQKVIKDKSSSRRNFQTKLGSLGVSHGPTQFQRYRARPKSKLLGRNTNSRQEGIPEKNQIIEFSSKQLLVPNLHAVAMESLNLVWKLRIWM